VRPAGALVAVLCVTAAICAGLVWFRKPPPERVFWPMFALAAWVPLGLAGRPPTAARRTAGWGILVGLALLAGWRGRWALASYGWQTRENRTHQAWLRTAIADMAPRPDRLFIVWGSAIPWPRLDPFGATGFLRDLRVVSLGTELATPPARVMMERFGVRDPLRELVGRSDLFLVVHEPRFADLYLAHVKERHGLDVALRTVRSNGEFDVLEVVAR
jgi:hypothetical protein